MHSRDAALRVQEALQMQIENSPWLHGFLCPGCIANVAAMSSRTKLGVPLHCQAVDSGGYGLPHLFKAPLNLLIPFTLCVYTLDSRFPPRRTMLLELA